MAHLPITTIVVHCTGSHTRTTREMVDEWHKANGWSGIGYQYLIQAGGIVRKGRADSTVGAHVKGHNTGSIGVCVSGDPKAGKRWDPEQEYQLYTLLADLCEAHERPSSAVVGHYELDPKNKPDCPGVDMDYIREQVEARLRA